MKRLKVTDYAALSDIGYLRKLIMGIFASLYLTVYFKGYGIFVSPILASYISLLRKLFSLKLHGTVKYVSIKHFTVPKKFKLNCFLNNEIYIYRKYRNYKDRAFSSGIHNV